MSFSYQPRCIRRPRRYWVWPGGPAKAGNSRFFFLYIFSFSFIIDFILGSSDYIYLAFTIVSWSAFKVQSEVHITIVSTKFILRCTSPLRVHMLSYGKLRLPNSGVIWHTRHLNPLITPDSSLVPVATSNHLSHLFYSNVSQLTVDPFFSNILFNLFFLF